MLPRDAERRLLLAPASLSRDELLTKSMGELLLASEDCGSVDPAMVALKLMRGLPFEQTNLLSATLNTTTQLRAADSPPAAETALVTAAFPEILIAACLLVVFYQRNFSPTAPSTWVRAWRKTNLLKFILYSLVCKHIAMSAACPVWCSLACASVQVPPFRRLFTAYTGRWPSQLAAVMPAPRVDQSLRQLLGPMFVMFVVKSAIRYFAVAPWLSTTAAAAGVFAGCFARPDNDWAGTHLCIRRVFSDVKRVHGALMCVSTVCSITLRASLCIMPCA
jgi:hypothetical protein